MSLLFLRNSISKLESKVTCVIKRSKYLKTSSADQTYFIIINYIGVFSWRVGGHRVKTTLKYQDFIHKTNFQGKF